MIGITLKDKPLDPMVGNTINVDRLPEDTKPDVAGIQAICDAKESKGSASQ